MAKENQSISIATYNVLADAYIRPEYYPLCDPESFRPEKRHPLLVERVAELATDVICLQEVDYEMFARIHARMSKVGYFGRWAHKSMGKKDGCATFIHESLEVRGCCILEYEDAAPGGMRSGHVALLTVVVTHGFALSIVNTHLKFDSPDATDAQTFGLRQSELLLDLVSQGEIPSVLCGDFNAEHGGAILGSFTKAGYLDAHGPEVYTCAFNGRPQKIDHILHVPRLVSRPLPTPCIDGTTPLPSAMEPSDHLPLRASFVLAE